MTGYLETVIEVTRPYDVVAPVLGELIDWSGSGRILDLASGGGGPWPELRSRLDDGGRRVSVTLSDIAPSSGAQERFAQTRSFTYLSEPLSALSPPESEHGIWTMFTGLHHFSPPEVKEIMRSAESRKVTFCAFEATSRSGRGIAVTLLVPILVLLLMPRVRPRRVLPLLLTYLPPILPVLIWWDALASTMRTYTVDELEALARDSSTETYEWRVRQLRAPGAPIPVLSLVGRPVEPV